MVLIMDGNMFSPMSTLSLITCLPLPLSDSLRTSSSYLDSYPPLQSSSLSQRLRNEELYVLQLTKMIGRSAKLPTICLVASSVRLVLLIVSEKSISTP